MSGGQPERAGAPVVVAVPEGAATPSKPPRAPGDVGTPLMVACQALLALVGLALWQGASGRLIDEFFVSSPRQVAARLAGWTLDGSIFVHLWATLLATGLGFLAGSAAGVVLGVWLGVSRFVSRLLDPFLWAVNALPKVALAPLFVLWFGLDIHSKVALAAVLVLFLVFANTYGGVRDVDPDLVDCARLMRATRLQVLVKVIVPSAASWIFLGLRVGVPYALIGAILGEMIAANRGLGYLIQHAGSEFDTAGVFAVLVVIAVVAAALNQVVNAAQGRLERWKVVGQ